MKNSPQILIVDDIEYNVILLNQILLNAGYRVLTAMHGKKCLEILETELPDIILLDVIMPEINGFDIAETLKQNDRTKDIPIIFLSAISDYETKLKGLEKGAVDYITKPYDDREVIARIQIHLKIRDLEKERVEHIRSLETLNKDKDSLLQVIAHDMRSPLTSIMLMSEFMMGTEKAIDKEKLNKYSNTIFNSSKKILELINQLMHTSKAETSKVVFSNFDLVKTISQSTDLIGRILDKKMIKLEAKFFSPEIIVNLDESKMDQILNNLLYNAIKFTNSSGLIRITAEIKRVDELDLLHISIADNGIGIPSSILPEILTKKFSYHRVGTEGEEGTGLGLSITKDLVNALNGKIEIESQENLGTNVHLYFYKY
ncbi:MAG: hybrid sensor histidine kinase/response regulator [Leptospiraceae bacterium]|jgi:signal transduction histidine kinase|nr:hybrid sensor histidine kinase/response regulator [Leptospiraceae bacterium]